MGRNSSEVREYQLSLPQVDDLYKVDPGEDLLWEEALVFSQDESWLKIMGKIIGNPERGKLSRRHQDMYKRVQLILSKEVRCDKGGHWPKLPQEPEQDKQE